MGAKGMTESELFALSDDEIMNMVDDPVMTPTETVEQPTEEIEEKPEADAASEDAGSDEEVSTETPAKVEDDDAESAEDVEDEEAAESAVNPLSAADDAEVPAPKEASTKPAEKPAKKPDEETPVEVGSETKSTEAAPAIDYKAAYDKVMAPFKAAGKEIKLNSPEEVVSLMQMGAHYTKKMQALQPNLKLLRMLENNGLLDEGKLSFLIDVNRKDPAAIQKLVKDSGIDPLDIDTSAPPAYTPGDHRVSDEDIRFTTVLDEVTSDPDGKSLVVAINNTWDKASKETLWTDPSILKVLTGQKTSGIYDEIANEIDRRKTLGQLQNESFLAAYGKVGKEMDAKGLLTRKTGTPPAEAANTAATPSKARQIVETRPAAKKALANSDRVKAAMPTRGNPSKQVAADFNPLSMSDEDFEKNATLAQRL